MINIKNICFSYNNTNSYQLDNINLTIPTGGFVSIIGENGSGKTTLLKLILGHLKSSKGTIQINSNKIGYVPQKIDNFNPEFTITVNEILKIYAKALKIKDSKEIDRVLNIVNMTNYKNKLIGSLSGGQQQRIFIARALMGNPSLLILDEPSTGLDEKTQEEIYGLLEKLNSNDNVTILCVEHNKEKAIAYSSHLLEVANYKGELYSKKDYLNKVNKDSFKRKVN